MAHGAMRISPCALERARHILPTGFSQPNPPVPGGCLSCAQAAVVSEEVHTRDRSRCAIRNEADFRSSGAPIPGCRVGVRRREKKSNSANRTAAGPPGPEAEAEEAEDRRPRWVPTTSWGLHACLHRHSEEAELGAPQGRPCPPFFTDGGHRVHSRRGPQPPGAQHRARSWRTCEGPSWCSLQGHPWCARRCRRRWPKAGPLTLRHEEGFVTHAPRSRRSSQD